MTSDIHTLRSEHLARQNSASNPIHSVWVSANAGAGKTHMLVERIIRLLLPPFSCPPHKILCLTYTKAAATEMTERLFGRLGAWITKSDSEISDDITKMTGQTPTDTDIVVARRLFATVLETAGGLKIQTIHSFCEHLLRRFPFEAGYPADFTLLSDVDLKNLFHKALEDLAVYCIHNPDSDMAKATDNVTNVYNLNDLIDLLISSRKIYHTVTSDNSEFWNPKRLCETLGLPINIEQTNIYDDFFALIDARKISALMSALETGGVNDNKKADILKYIQIKTNTSFPTLATQAERESCDDFPKDSLSFFLAKKNGNDEKHIQYHFTLWSELFLTSKKEMSARNRFVTKDIQKKFPELSDYLLSLYDAFEKTYTIHNGVLIYDLTKNVSLILDYVYRFVALEKHKNNACDFDDIIIRTRTLLMNPEISQWVLWKFDGGIDHIFVDEAQDTAPEQWDIINSLTQDFFKPNPDTGASATHKTIFAVGDEKQSIYGFQGAAPEKMAQMALVFETKAQQANKKWQPENLRGSFRSSPAIMNLVDNVFQNEAAAGVLFGDANRIEHYAVANMGPGYVEIMPPVIPMQNDMPDAWTDALDTVSNANPKAINAKRIAQRIQEILQSPTLLPSTGRPAEPKDIMILLQKRDATMLSLIKELITLKIPVSGLDRIYLLTEMAILDMLALIDFCLYPDDDLSLAQILRSPLCDTPEEDLFVLCHNRTGTLWHSLIHHKDIKQNFSEAHDFIHSVLHNAQTLSVFDFISSVLETHQGRKKFIARLGKDCLDGLDELLNKALAFKTNKNPTLQNFVSFMRQAGGDQKRQIDNSNNAIQIMTIHGSKGLEAPIVFLPDCCDTPSTNKDLYKRFILSNDNTPMLVKEGSLHRVIIDHKEFLKTKDEDENRRLLYVALTRARDWLFVSGKLRKSRSNNYKINEKSWYHYIKNGLLCLDNYDVIDSEHSDFPTYIYKDITTHEVTFKPHPVTTEVSPPAPLPVWAGTVPVRVQSDKQTFIAPSKASNTDYKQGNDFAKQRGIIIHKLLEILITAPQNSYDIMIDNFISHYNLPPNEQAQIKSSILNLLNDDKFSIFRNNNGLSEVPIIGQIPELGDLSVSGQIDRMVITDTEILIADYKTDKNFDNNFSLPNSYILQMALYQKLLTNLYPLKRVKCFVIFTQTIDLIEINHNLLEQSLKNYINKQHLKLA